MMKFRKKPVVIEAVRYGPVDFKEADDWMEKFGCPLIVYLGDAGKNDNAVCIPTLEGDMRLSAGDWIIRGVKGEFYPCKPDIFEATYEGVNE